MVRDEWGKVDRIVDKRYLQRSRDQKTHWNFRTTGDKTEYLIKWETLPYSQLTWESEAIVENHKDKLEKFEASLNTPKIKKKKHTEEEFQEYKTQPSYLPSQLFPWQLEGLNWLVYSMHKKRNVILADEMGGSYHHHIHFMIDVSGLGKTIQSMSFILHCSEACSELTHVRR